MDTMLYATFDSHYFMESSSVKKTSNWIFTVMPSTSTSPLIVSTSAYDVDTTVSRIQALLKEKNVNVFAVVDHSSQAIKNGLELSDEKLIIFGDPKVGTYLMQENPSIGIELPLKILVFRDQDGKTQVAYKNPNDLKSQYGIVKHADILEKMQGSLDQIVKKASM